MHDAHQFLETLALVLCAAAVTTVLFQRLRQPVVLGYLLAGMAIGPYFPIPLEADTNVVQTLAELGVILLMFSLGIEFSLPKLLRVGPTAAFVGVVQCSLMLWLGYVVGQAFGWTRLESIYAGAVISISSTTIIIKAFEEQRIKADFTHIVFGVLIVEDLIAILLITLLSALSVGEEVGPMELTLAAGRLTVFLVVLVVVGLFIVPRLTRAVVRLESNETTVVAAIGLAFGLAYLAAWQGYSVALGAFLAGSLVAESGVEKTVEHHVRPVRDIFAAIFFVSVGMLIDPKAVTGHWLLVLIFLAVVLVGKIGSVTLSALLTGRSVQTSVKCGMSMAQIGEFSFIIAGLGQATEITDEVLYSIAVAVSGITTLLTPWLIRGSKPTALFIDRKLPRAMQTFIALYGSWLERLRAPSEKSEQRAALRGSIRWLIADAVVVGVIVVGASINADRLRGLALTYLDVSDAAARLIVVAIVAAVASPFWIGMIRTARSVGFDLSNRAFPRPANQAIDVADAPRRLFVVTLQIASLLLVGLPLVAITQPFLPALQGAVVLIGLLVLLAFSFWRGATNFQGHTRAAAQAIVESLGRATREGREAAGANRGLQEITHILEGLGSPVAVQLQPESPAVGKTLAQVNLRGLTGATVLAIERGATAVSVPAGGERLLAGDILAVAGTYEAIEAAKQLLAPEGPSDLPA